MYPAFQAIRDAKPTDNHLLFSLLYFLRREDENAIDVDIDIPIKNLFSATLTEDALGLVIALFELHHAIDIPDSFCDWDLNIREFLRRLSTLPRLGPEEYRKHLHELVVATQRNARPN